MSKVEEFIETYEYIQGCLIGNPGYQYGKKKLAEKKVSEFLFNNPILTENIFDFITFIFVLRTSKFNRYTVIPFNQFTSKNAAKYYKERDGKINHFIRKFQLDHNLRDPFSKKVGLSVEYLDRVRRKHFDSPKGFLTCASYEGFLYDKIKCEGCKFNYICGDQNG